jgi:cell division protein FtsI (penicillin-binding protein 3)
MSSKERIYFRRRVDVIAGLLALGMAMLAIRAVDLQWFQSGHLDKLAQKQRYRTFDSVAPRGLITDDKGRILANSIEVPSISAIADEVPAKHIPALAKALGLPAKEVSRRLHAHSGFVWLSRQVAPEIASRVMALHIPGVRQEREWRRYQPQGPETGHVLGFVGVDGHGLEGLERSMDSELSGRPGLMQVRRDARGHSLPGGIWLRKPKMGQSIHLYLDSAIQSMAYAALVEGISANKAKSGSVVVMRPKDGAILAMVSWPSFNPNNFSAYQPRQWRNRAITDVFEPGSSLKPFTLAAGLLTGHWHPDSEVYCEKGHMRIANYVIHDDHPETWLDLTQILAKSSNIGAAKIALDVGPDRLHGLLSKLGFGERTGIGLGGESPGILPPIDKWGPVETANIAFGQGIAVTPLQLATAFCVLANGGMRVAPRLVEGLPVPPPERVLPKKITHQIMGMLDVAASPDGTGRLAVPAGYRVAGKTGTAQKVNPDGRYSDHRFTAVFAGTVPADHPALVIVVMIDEPSASIYGGKVSAPIFRQIAAAALPYLGIAPKQRQTAPWKLMQAATTMEPPAPRHGSLQGMSLRQVRAYAAENSLQLRVHGSGWVSRQSPANLASLDPGNLLEVWLNE